MPVPTSTVTALATTSPSHQAMACGQLRIVRNAASTGVQEQNTLDFGSLKVILNAADWGSFTAAIAGASTVPYTSYTTNLAVSMRNGGSATPGGLTIIRAAAAAGQPELNTITFGWYTNGPKFVFNNADFTALQSAVATAAA